MMLTTGWSARLISLAAIFQIDEARRRRAAWVADMVNRPAEEAAGRGIRTTHPAQLRRSVQRGPVRYEGLDDAALDQWLHHPLRDRFGSSAPRIGQATVPPAATACTAIIRG